MEFLSIFGNYRFLAACAFVTAITCYSLAALILFANPRSHLCRIAFAFKLSVGTWSVFYGLMYYSGNGEVGLLVNKIIPAVALFIGVFFIQLTAELTGETKSLKNLIVGNYIYASFFFVIIFCSPFFVKYPVPKLDFPSYSDAGPLYFLLPGQMLFSATFSLILLIRHLRNEKDSAKKNQFRIFVFATIVSFITGMLSYFLCFNIPIKPVTTPFVVVYPLLISYAIIRHRFLDIRKLARNTLIFSLLFVCLLGVVSALLFIFQKALLEKLGLSAAACQFLAIIVALMLYSPLKRGLSIATRKLLYQHTQDAALIFRRLSEDLFKFMEVKKLAEEMTLRVASCLSLERIAFYRREGAQSDYKLHSSIGNEQIVKEFSGKESLIQYLEYSERFLLNPYGSKDRRVIADYKNDLVVNTEWLRESALDRLINGEWAVALPIFNKEQLDSFVLMGHKKSDASWTQEELGVLESFAHSLSLALVNADAAEAIRTLQRKILASERDASSGALIAGVDHEAKNPLHAASLALSSLDGFLTHPKFLAQQREDQETSVKETMQSVLEDIEEVNHVIQHLSNLAEQKPLRIQEGVVLAEVCRKALKTSGVASQIQMHLEFAESFNLTCDPEALQEILSNLIRNASQAGANKLWIHAYRDHSAITIDVKDSGGGIPDSIAQRIFDPFFTTKDRKDGAESAGTGMGLFIVRESMRAMGGDIELMSKVKQGTTFRLLFRGYPKTERGVS